MTDRLNEASAWTLLQSFAILENVRTVGGDTTTERRTHVIHLPADAE
jgi:hypothetical protein